MTVESEFAAGLRTAYAEARKSASQAANSVRYNETLLHRLLPLRAQYAEDERKLHFFSEAKALFDPLQIEVCPSCLQELPEAMTIAGQRCTLCQREVPEGEAPIDVKAEIRAVKARRRELERYIDEVEDTLRCATQEYDSARELEQRAQRDLDAAVAESLSPYVAERDRLVSERQRFEDAIRNIETQTGWHESLDRRQIEIGRLEEQITQLRQQIKEREATQVSRDELLDTLTGRFSAILGDFSFPKLNDPQPPSLDPRFAPHVRGVSYRDIGSAGAMTLIALAWQLALFELAVEEGHPHPRLLDDRQSAKESDARRRNARRRIRRPRDRITRLGPSPCLQHAHGGQSAAADRRQQTTATSRLLGRRPLHGHPRHRALRADRQRDRIEPSNFEPEAASPRVAGAAPWGPCCRQMRPRPLVAGRAQPPARR